MNWERMGLLYESMAYLKSSKKLFGSIRITPTYFTLPTCREDARGVAGVAAATPKFQVLLYKMVLKISKFFYILCRLHQFQIPNVLPAQFLSRKKGKWKLEFSILSNSSSLKIRWRKNGAFLIKMLIGKECSFWCSLNFFGLKKFKRKKINYF